MEKVIPENTWFLVIRSSNEGLHEHTLKPGRNSLGRDVDNNIVLHDNAASSYHVEINYDQRTNEVTIKDLKSTNGTFVNGKRLLGSKTLHHEDQIRVGHCLISIISSQIQSSLKSPLRYMPTKVTGELLLESVDQFGFLLHEVGKRLVDIPNLDTALLEISVLIQRMIGADECQVLLADKFGELTRLGIPASFTKETIETQSATIFSDKPEKIAKKDSLDKEPITQQFHSKMIVPVIIDQKVVALIFAKKSDHSPNPFNNSDLQLVLAVSNQVAMSIQRSRVEGELIHRSNFDSLTDLPNRPYFIDFLSRSIARSKAGKGGGFAVLFFDIDDFKVVNDSLGHATGDKLLIAVAERLKHNVRNIDLVARNSVIARFGGDEFAILLDDIDESSYAILTAIRLKEILSKPYNIAGKQIFTSVSIGVAVSKDGYEKPDDILRDADLAMYQAKELGKARVEVYDETMHARATERMHMGTALRQGALQKEFRLHYQPIVSLQTGKIVGFEALMRWYTPDKGILIPADFMAAIDTAGLVYTTDHWVLRTACQQAVEWSNNFPSNPPLFISVNLSAKNIKHPNLVDNINQVLQETKLDPKTLWIEITENVSAPDDEATIEILSKLRSIGIHISLDDFGSGYSALNYLAKFPVDALKIDRSFVKMIGENDDNHKVIEMIMALANHLKLVVIAEGVEKAEQLPFLISKHCEYAQGYFYAKPLDTISATNLLSTRHHW